MIVVLKIGFNDKYLNFIFKKITKLQKIETEWDI